MHDCSFPACAVLIMHLLLVTVVLQWATVAEWGNWWPVQRSYKHQPVTVYTRKRYFWYLWWNALLIRVIVALFVVRMLWACIYNRIQYLSDMFGFSLMIDRSWLPLLCNELAQIVLTRVPLLQSSISWCWPKGGDAQWLRRWLQAWRKVMAACCWFLRLWSFLSPMLVSSVELPLTLIFWRQFLVTETNMKNWQHPFAVTFLSILQLVSVFVRSNSSSGLQFCSL